jgi:hypothetical protein
LLGFHCILKYQSPWHHWVYIATKEPFAFSFQTKQYILGYRNSDLAHFSYVYYLCGSGDVGVCDHDHIYENVSIWQRSMVSFPRRYFSVSHLINSNIKEVPPKKLIEFLLEFICSKTPWQSTKYMKFLKSLHIYFPMFQVWPGLLSDFNS